MYILSYYFTLLLYIIFFVPIYRSQSFILLLSKRQSLAPYGTPLTAPKETSTIQATNTKTGIQYWTIPCGFMFHVDKYTFQVQNGFNQGDKAPVQNF